MSVFRILIQNLKEFLSKEKKQLVWMIGIISGYKHKIL